MKINGGTPGSIRPDAAREIRTPGADGATKGQSAPSALDRQDRVEISDAGRARAAELAPLGATGAGRLQDIRQRVLQGAYDSSAVVADVAQRILDRGDV